MYSAQSHKNCRLPNRCSIVAPSNGILEHKSSTISETRKIKMAEYLASIFGTEKDK